MKPLSIIRFAKLIERQVSNGLCAFFLKQTNRTITFYAILVSVFVFAYIINHLQPLFNDDWLYVFVWGSHTERIQTFPDVIYSQWQHYRTWGGRTPAHVTLQSLLLLGKGWSDILNSFVFSFFIWISYKICNIGSYRKPNLGLLVGIILLTWFLQPLGSAALWLTGSCNYLWTTTFVLAFIYPFCQYYVTDRDSNSLLKTIFLPLLAVLAGWTNENLSVSLAFFVLILIIVLKFERRGVPHWVAYSALGAGIGFLLLIMAPGNYVRLAEVVAHESLSSSFLGRILRGIYSVLYFYFFKGIVVTMVYAVVYVFYKYFSQGSQNQRWLSHIFIFSAIVGVLSMAISPVFPDRAWFGPFTFVVLASGLLYANISFSSSFLIGLKNVIFFFGILVMLGQYILWARDTKDIQKVFAKRESELLEQKSQGKQDIVFDIELDKPTSHLSHIEDLSRDSADWKNELYSQYYGVRSVRIK
jgi:hypothetical protein